MQAGSSMDTAVIRECYGYGNMQLQQQQQQQEP